MKLLIPILSLFFILLSGCKTSSGDAPKDASTEDTVVLALAKAEFKVNGMHCTGCENTIKGNIKEINGVKTVDASFKENKAVVSFDSTKTNEKAILAAIEEAGYKVDTFMRK